MRGNLQISLSLLSNSRRHKSGWLRFDSGSGAHVRRCRSLRSECKKFEESAEKDGAIQPKQPVSLAGNRCAAREIEATPPSAVACMRAPAR